MTNTGKIVHPKNGASFVSHCFFCWQLVLLFKKWMKKFDEDSLVVPAKEHRAQMLGNRLESFWGDEEKFHKKPSLLRALLKMFSLELMVCGLTMLPFNLILALVPPIVIGQLLTFLDTATTNQLLVWGGILTIGTLPRVFAHHIFFLQLTSFGMKIRIACSSMVYRKLLILKITTVQKTAAGQIVNLLTNDVERFDKGFTFFHSLWLGPLRILALAYLLVANYGYTSCIGIIVPILFILLQVYTSKKFSANRKRVAVKTDARMRIMSNIISGIRVIKMFTWEKPFSNLVYSCRISELAQIQTANRLRMRGYLIMLYFYKIAIFLSVLVIILTDAPLTPQYLFTVVFIFNTLGDTCYDICHAIIALSEMLTSVRRIQQFLVLDVESGASKQQLCVLRHFHALEVNDVEVVLDNVTVKWDSGLEKNALTAVTFRATSGQLVALTGASGKGKSTLLHAVLKEIRPVHGAVNVKGVTSYASQDPWIFSASIKENILFGDEMDEQKYNEVIRVCALEHDIVGFRYGDNTLVGERGVMLSGGQKARINLARAVYRNADIYLLDDPLSAVDSHVADHIFNECILNYLKKKCVIFVTHQLQFLKSVDKIVTLDDGKLSDVSSTGAESTNDKRVVEARLETYELAPETLEDRGSGTVSAYKSYYLAGGAWTCFSVFLLFSLMCLLSICSDYFLAFWINVKRGDVQLNPTALKLFQNYNILYVIVFLILVSILLTHLILIVYAQFCRKAGKHLHDSLFEKVLLGSLHFFNNHSSGRILNRFSKDIGIVDEFIPLSLEELKRSIVSVIGMFVLVVISNYWMIIPTFLLIVVIFLEYLIFQPIIRNVKKIEGVRRSPIFTQLSASVQGLTTIRAFKLEKELLNEFDNHQNVHSSTYYLHTATHHAFAFWIDLATLIYATLAIFGVLSANAAAGTVGLVITQTLFASCYVQYILKIWGDCDAQMTSVERIVEFRDLTPEKDTGSVSPPESWPSEGNITFKSVSMQYSLDKPFVLKDVNLTINAGEKIGIIGRTGAGKSTLIKALFRLFDYEGEIFIDGLDTKSLPLKVLRSKISIIPQDPVLFFGTLRQNIDPFNEYSDDQLWQALEDAELREVVANLPSGLESEISEGGCNLSVGQRQLLCLVRVILKGSKIVALDEATASVDLKTDEIIQRTIRKRFKNATVLTIAHRINTVLDSDKILVMENGNVVEFDETRTLSRNNESYFYKYLENKN